MKKRIFCNFPPNLIKEPILSQSLPTMFSVKPNIRGAQISDDFAIVLVDIEGEDHNIDQAIQYLRTKGVNVKEVDANEPITRPPQLGDV
ncbi:MAG: NIL domain-containing protein [Planctomycetes bacterium]|nr:NIL domain-containing protein [Planctomycetota bacterium]